MVTLFGMVPLALGIVACAELQRPLAVVGGLALSTIVTLYLIAALYAGLHRRAVGAAGRAPW